MRFDVCHMRNMTSFLECMETVRTIDLVPIHQLEATVIGMITHEDFHIETDWIQIYPAPPEGGAKK